MPYIIDAHQDLAYNAATFGRNYLRSAVETRQRERGTATPERTGHTLLGWPEYQRGQVAVIISTLFAAPQRYGGGAWETQVFKDTAQAYQLYMHQLNFYRRLTDEHPDQFRLIYSQRDLREVLEPWLKTPASLSASSSAPEDNDDEEPQASITHPVGLVLSMEGLEGIRSPEEMEEWWELGVRLAGPVWAGTRFCGGMYESGNFRSEGMALLEVMAELGFTLDISHMNEQSALQALDRYEGPVIASHANARALLREVENERQLSDKVIHRLIERDGVMGVVPFNHFLNPNWSPVRQREEIPLSMLAAHIDHICQLAGDDRHVGLGTDFDGGFGWPSVPYEINTIDDLQKLAPVLGEYGYGPESVARIFGENWRQHLERTLPET